MEIKPSKRSNRNSRPSGRNNSILLQLAWKEPKTEADVIKKHGGATDLLTDIKTEECINDPTLNDRENSILHRRNEFEMNETDDRMHVDKRYDYLRTRTEIKCEKNENEISSKTNAVSEEDVFELTIVPKEMAKRKEHEIVKSAEEDQFERQIGRLISDSDKNIKSQNFRQQKRDRYPVRLKCEAEESCTCIIKESCTCIIKERTSESNQLTKTSNVRWCNRTGSDRDSQKGSIYKGDTTIVKTENDSCIEGSLGDVMALTVVHRMTSYSSESQTDVAEEQVYSKNIIREDSNDEDTGQEGTVTKKQKHNVVKEWPPQDKSTASGIDDVIDVIDDDDDDDVIIIDEVDFDDVVKEHEKIVTNRYKSPKTDLLDDRISEDKMTGKKEDHVPNQENSVTPVKEGISQDCYAENEIKVEIRGRESNAAKNLSENFFKERSLRNESNDRKFNTEGVEEQESNVENKQLPLDIKQLHHRSSCLIMDETGKEKERSMSLPFVLPSRNMTNAGVSCAWQTRSNRGENLGGHDLTKRIPEIMSNRITDMSPQNSTNDVIYEQDRNKSLPPHNITTNIGIESESMREIAINLPSRNMTFSEMGFLPPRILTDTDQNLRLRSILNNRRSSITHKTSSDSSDAATPVAFQQSNGITNSNKTNNDTRCETVTKDLTNYNVHFAPRNLTDANKQLKTQKLSNVNAHTNLVDSNPTSDNMANNTNTQFTPQHMESNNRTSTNIQLTPQNMTSHNMTNTNIHLTPQNTTGYNMTNANLLLESQGMTYHNMTNTSIQLAPLNMTNHNATNTNIQLTPQNMTNHNTTNTNIQLTPQNMTNHNTTNTIVQLIPQNMTNHNTTNTIVQLIPQNMTNLNTTNTNIQLTPQNMTNHNMTNTNIQLKPQNITHHNTTNTIVHLTPQTMRNMTPHLRMQNNKNLAPRNMTQNSMNLSYHNMKHNNVIIAPQNMTQNNILLVPQNMTQNNILLVPQNMTQNNMYLVPQNITQNSINFSPYKVTQNNVKLAPQNMTQNNTNIAPQNMTHSNVIFASQKMTHSNVIFASQNMAQHSMNLASQNMTQNSTILAPNNMTQNSMDLEPQTRNIMNLAPQNMSVIDSMNLTRSRTTDSSDYMPQTVTNSVSDPTNQSTTITDVEITSLNTMESKVNNNPSPMTKSGLKGLKCTTQGHGTAPYATNNNRIREQFPCLTEMMQTEASTDISSEKKNFGNKRYSLRTKVKQMTYEESSDSELSEKSDTTSDATFEGDSDSDMSEFNTVNEKNLENGSDVDRRGEVNVRQENKITEEMSVAESIDIAINDRICSGGQNHEVPVVKDFTEDKSSNQKQIVESNQDFTHEHPVLPQTDTDGIIYAQTYTEPNQESESAINLTNRNISSLVPKDIVMSSENDGDDVIFSNIDKTNSFRRENDTDFQTEMDAEKSRELEGKWEYMYGEQGTFQRLKKKHPMWRLCVYNESKAFRNCFKYMEWNCHMKCLHCNLVFGRFSDFVLHSFGDSPCSLKNRRVVNGVIESRKKACIPCGRTAFPLKCKWIKHMLKEKSHGHLKCAYIPKSIVIGPQQNTSKVSQNSKGTRRTAIGKSWSDSGLDGFSTESKRKYQEDQSPIKQMYIRTDSEWFDSFQPGYHCKVCGTSTGVLPSLCDAVQHIKNEHTKEEKTPFRYRREIYYNGKKTIGIQSNEESHLCFVCGRSFKRNTSLYMHLAAAHKDIPSEKLGIQDKRRSCPHCDRTFSVHHQRYFHRHLQTHCGPVNCKKCGRTFKHRAAYLRHASIHSGVDFKCELCGKVYKNKHNYKQHLRNHRLSKKARKYHCETCDKFFITNGHLKTHVRIHSSERPFKCANCDATFKFKNHLKNHLHKACPKLKK